MKSCQNPTAEKCKQKSSGQTESNLQEKHQRHLSAAVVFSAHHRQKNHGQHIRKRVITAAFHFEHGGCGVFQIHLFGTENRKNGSRIGGADDSAHQKGFYQREIKSIKAKTAYQKSRQNGSQRGQQNRFHRRRPGSTPFRAGAAIKHDENKCHGTYFIGKGIIIKRNLENAVRTEKHAQQNKNK